MTDHVPVDDNPAYMTMKRIHMNKNSAYETVTQIPSVKIQEFDHFNITSYM